MYDERPDITVFAETNYRNQRRRFGIKRDDRRRHMYLIGKTGMGKSVMLENMVMDDIYEGHGLAYIDPHGDTAEKLLDFIPSSRVNDVVYFNPADFEYPVAFNILETVNENQKHLVASAMMGVFKKIWPDVWSARMEYILNNTLLALLDYKDSTMLAVNQMLSNKAFRKKVIEHIKDPIVKSFWVDEFGKYTEKFAQEAIAPIQNKVGQFLSAAVIRNIIGQVKSTISIREIMDSGKIFIVNLSKGRIGEDNSRLLGGMLVTKIQMAAMERVDVPKEDDRKDFYLYVDEFQNFATESFASILSEARKYRLNLIMAHQYIEQLDEKVCAGVFGNVGTIVSFRVGATDAEYLAKEFAPRFIEEDFVSLPKYNFFLKLMIDGIASEPFSAAGLPPWGEEEKSHNMEKVISVSRERYATPKDIVEEKIMRWAETLNEEASALEPEKKIKKFEEPTGPTPERPYSGTCTRCAKTVYLNFQPDGVRPVYCRDCFAIVREEKEKGITSPTRPLIPPTSPAPTVVIPTPASNDEEDDDDMSLDQISHHHTKRF
ncbi:MAG: type IV secretion system DNA-binding domain-containing protein [bacterium]|nr:type IV secretion system DNA-binding domain-containing protein [bacterium]